MSDLKLGEPNPTGIPGAVPVTSAELQDAAEAVVSMALASSDARQPNVDDKAAGEDWDHSISDDLRPSRSRRLFSEPRLRRWLKLSALLPCSDHGTGQALKHRVVRTALT